MTEPRVPYTGLLYICLYHGSSLPVLFASRKSSTHECSECFLPAILTAEILTATGTAGGHKSKITCAEVSKISKASSKDFERDQSTLKIFQLRLSLHSVQFISFKSKRLFHRRQMHCFVSDLSIRCANCQCCPRNSLVDRDPG